MATLVAEERTRTRRRRTKRREWRALAAETGDSAQPDDALAVVINVGGDRAERGQAGAFAAAAAVPCGHCLKSQATATFWPSAW
jgi:hypothetical protein